MKKHALTIILMIIISFSCSNNESEKDTTTSTIDYSALSKSVDNQVIIFGKIIADSNNGEKFTKYFKTEPLNLNSSKSAPKEK
ncbi:MAG TPA: hypothetical protein VFQ56_02085, partial [Flavobacterium sp.]|nr:hypothetical protein [Flavobacterium sp.]